MLGARPVPPGESPSPSKVRSPRKLTTSLPVNIPSAAKKSSGTEMISPIEPEDALRVVNAIERADRLLPNLFAGISRRDIPSRIDILVEAALQGQNNQLSTFDGDLSLSEEPQISQTDDTYLYGEDPDDDEQFLVTAMRKASDMFKVMPIRKLKTLCKVMRRQKLESDQNDFKDSMLVVQSGAVSVSVGGTVLDINCGESFGLECLLSSRGLNTYSYVLKPLKKPAVVWSLSCINYQRAMITHARENLDQKEEVSILFLAFNIQFFCHR